MKNKHAFLILAHAHPEQLEEIVGLLSAPNHYFFIHIDKKNEIILISDAMRRLQANDKVVVLKNRLRTNHGGFSLVQATLNLLQTACEHPAQMDYMHLISGQDFPCVSNVEFDRIFSDGYSYMHFDSPQETLEWRKKKYPSRMQHYNFVDLYLPFLPEKWLKLLIKVLNKAAKLLPPRPFPPIYAGWQWFSWHRNVVEFVLRFVEDHPQYVRRFKRAIYIDELFFHTFLFDHTEELNIVKNPKRFIVWNPKRPTASLPMILDEREYDEIAASDAVFCRKIHPKISAKLKKMLIAKIQAADNQPQHTDLDNIFAD
ncbi:MAG: beta-1,6-N-acetylglucosaminyltransferase [Candidatus Symbiothrix sp.]|jgi:hypothetical protein|nr:beta-1,6-N-acetylglucosaminyltransferase [Candidatus Symbiothrix sp.]